MKQVKVFPNENGGHTVLVDGIDVSRYVLRDGIVIEFRAGVAYVTLPLAGVLLAADLPAAVVEALAPEVGIPTSSPAADVPVSRPGWRE